MKSQLRTMVLVSGLSLTLTLAVQTQITQVEARVIKQGGRGHDVFLRW